MQRYALNTTIFNTRLKQKGYRHVADFVRQHGLNRMTLYHYFRGEGPLPEAYYRLCKILDADPLEFLSPISENNVDLQLEEIFPLVKKVATKYPQLAFGLFGSRAKGKAKKFSDWDIGVTGGVSPLGTPEYVKIKTELGDLAEDLPRSVDVIFLDAAPVWFLEETNYQPVFLAGDEKSWQYFLGVLNGVKKKDR